jgi:NAD(P)-dependent dehydrogenase (short-subunit alcohol dehydrogenase family)
LEPRQGHSPWNPLFWFGDGRGGAGRCIGKGIAQVLAETGADLALNALTPNHVTAIAAAIAAASGRRVVPVVADGTQPDEVRRAVAQILATFGRIDVPVNASGDTIRKPLVTLPGRRTAAPASPTTSCGSSWTST